MPTDDLVFNGINGASGDYLLPSMTPGQMSNIIRGEQQDPEHLKELLWWYRRITLGLNTYGPMEGIDPKNLAETGWGVIFAHDADPKIKDALKGAAGAPARTGSEVLPGI